MWAAASALSSARWTLLYLPRPRRRCKHEYEKYNDCRCRRPGIPAGQQAAGTALSDAVPEAQTEQATENIGDGKTALAAAPVSEETLSWWWLLIIAVLGGAGYAMYKKFQTKQDEKTTN